jgi:hypothetical protein
MLVNLKSMEIRNDKDKIGKFVEDNFETKTGLALAAAKFID